MIWVRGPRSLEAVARPARRGLVPTGEEPGAPLLTSSGTPPVHLPPLQIAEGALLKVSHGDAITLTEVGRF